MLKFNADIDIDVNANIKCEQALTPEAFFLFCMLVSSTWCAPYLNQPLYGVVFSVEGFSSNTTALHTPLNTQISEDRATMRSMLS